MAMTLQDRMLLYIAYQIHLKLLTPESLFVFTVLFLSTQILCPFQNIMNVYHYLKLSYVFENNAKK